MEKMSRRYYGADMRKPPAPSDMADKFMLRMPDGLRDRIAQVAKANGRSMNSEIVRTLENNYPHPIVRKVAEAALREIVKKLDENPDADLNWNLQVMMPDIVGLVEAGAILSTDDIDVTHESGRIYRYEESRFDLDKS